MGGMGSFSAINSYHPFNLELRRASVKSNCVFLHPLISALICYGRPLVLNVLGPPIQKSLKYSAALPITKGSRDDGDWQP